MLSRLNVKTYPMRLIFSGTKNTRFNIMRIKEIRLKCHAEVFNVGLGLRDFSLLENRGVLIFVILLLMNFVPQPEVGF